MLEDKDLDKVPLWIQYPRTALLVCCVAEEKARLDHKSRWFVHLVLAVYLPGWLHNDKDGPKFGWPAIDAKRLGTNERHFFVQDEVAWDLKRKPLCIQESIHFWGGSTAVGTVVMVTDLLPIGHR